MTTFVFCVVCINSHALEQYSDSESDTETSGGAGAANTKLTAKKGGMHTATITMYKTMRTVLRLVTRKNLLAPFSCVPFQHTTTSNITVTPCCHSHPERVARYVLHSLMYATTDGHMCDEHDQHALHHMT